MIVLLAEETEENLLSNYKSIKSKKLLKIINLIKLNLDQFTGWKTPKEFPKLISFWGSNKRDYLWLLSRKEGESYYIGSTWFDKRGSLFGNRFYTKQYRLSETSRRLIASEEINVHN